MQLTIRVYGGEYDGSVVFWPIVERFIASMCGIEAGRLTTIRRIDGQVNYRGPGDYVLLFVPTTPAGDTINVTLELKDRFLGDGR